MKCSAGVAITAVIVLLGSALTMLGAIGMVFVYHSMNLASAPTQQMPPGFTPDTMRYFGYVLCAFFLALGALGAGTGVGLLQLWRWARYSMITFGAVLAFFGLMSGVMMLLIPIPVPDNNAGLLLGIRIGISLFYGLWVILGLFFVVFFTRKKIADQFRGPVSTGVAVGEGTVIPDPPPLRPVSITVIAWFMMISALFFFPISLFANYPAMICGFLVNGVSAKMFLSAWGVAYLLFGIGLLRYKMWALWGTVSILVFGVLNMAVLLLPAPKARYLEFMKAYSNTAYPNPFLESSVFIPFMMLTSIIALGIPLYFLLTRRKRFEAAALVTSSSQQLPSPPATLA